MSLGCAIIGGLLFGPAGFVAGALVNNQKKEVIHVNSKSKEPVKIYGKNYISIDDFIDNIDYFYKHRKEMDYYDISLDEDDAIAKLELLQDYEEYGNIDKFDKK